MKWVKRMIDEIKVNKILEEIKTLNAEEIIELSKRVTQNLRHTVKYKPK